MRSHRAPCDLSSQSMISTLERLWERVLGSCVVYLCISIKLVLSVATVFTNF